MFWASDKVQKVQTSSGKFRILGQTIQKQFRILRAKRSENVQRKFRKFRLLRVNMSEKHSEFPRPRVQKKKSRKRSRKFRLGGCGFRIQCLSGQCPELLCMGNALLSLSLSLLSSLFSLSSSLLSLLSRFSLYFPLSLSLAYRIFPLSLLYVLLCLSLSLSISFSLSLFLSFSSLFLLFLS